MADHRDQIKAIIQRYDAYINGVNTKGSFLLVFNTFLISVICSNYNTVLTKLESHNAIVGFKIILTVFILIALFGIVSIFRAVYPFLKSGNSSIEGYHSLIFFNSVAEIDSDLKFKEKFDAQTDSQMLNDLILQSYQLARGLKNKFRFIERAMYCIYIELFLISLMAIYLQIF